MRYRIPAVAGTRRYENEPWSSEVVGATLPLWIPAPYLGTGHAFDRRNDESVAGTIRFRTKSYHISLSVAIGTPPRPIGLLRPA